MKVIEDSPQRFVVTSRRKIIADLASLFFLSVGALIAYAMTQENMRDILNVFALFLGLLFNGIGAFGLFHNASDEAVLDATTRTITIKRHRLTGRDTLAIPFSELADIFVHEDDDMHTIAFSVKGRDNILLETAFSGNRKVAPLARRMRDWLDAQTAP
ncbi:hypothetical protein KUL25_19040 [Rhodobacteraceae bacterium N5(2021)]|uniref:Uncharacterized protein n=1 Tax=Gymnodinialimonas phycosphaerae TaxID=2841589 RepID=A0A975TUJ4_9RHOB|nr:hypothetical protein [Gymnodinialimonas phycosphaerae]MBY4894859.1 hypothetical protein [Gymnodinialimonas phycosphaerae]